MSNPDERVLRGINIAAFVLSILMIIVSLALIIGGIGSGAATTNPTLLENAAQSINNSSELGTYGSVTSQNVAGALAVVVIVLTMIGIWLLICGVINLVASILGIRNYNKVEKMGSTFGWAVAGAVFAFLSANLVNLVLLIISCIKISKLRSVPLVPYGQPQPYAQAYGQPQPPLQPNPYGSVEQAQPNAATDTMSQHPTTPPQPPTPPVQ